MKLLKNRQNVFGNGAKYDSIIGSSISEINADPSMHQKKITEVCHVGKFLMLLGEQNTIVCISETPDFIVSVNGEQIGLEHQIVIDQVSKEREGFIENIFSIAEAELSAEDGLPNFLANCYLPQNFTYQLSDKARLIDEIKNVVRHYIKNKTLPSNCIIEAISTMRHSGKSINPNFGAWWQKSLTTEVLMSAIARKEKKVSEYVQKTALKQWLLLVIGGINDSSYAVNGDLQLELATQFDKVYLLEDLGENLYEIK
jgi:hypothetical protein